MLYNVVQLLYNFAYCDRINRLCRKVVPRTKQPQQTPAIHLPGPRRASPTSARHTLEMARTKQCASYGHGHRAYWAAKLVAEEAFESIYVNVTICIVVQELYNIVQGCTTYIVNTVYILYNIVQLAA